jgi:hypothetical protein
MRQTLLEKKSGRENKQAQAPLQNIENRNTDDVVLELAGWLACEKSKLCAFSLSLSFTAFTTPSHT